LAAIIKDRARDQEIHAVTEILRARHLHLPLAESVQLRRHTQRLVLHRRLSNDVDGGEHSIRPIQRRRRTAHNLDPLDKIQVYPEVLGEEVRRAIDVSVSEWPLIITRKRLLASPGNE